jgi:hypothetical protein
MSYIKTYDQQVYEIQVKSRRKSELDAAVKQIGKNITGVQSGTSNMADLD